MKFNKSPQVIHNNRGYKIPSFIDDNHQNIDLKTVESFGQEWSKFANFSKIEIEDIGNDYFDIVPWQKLGDSPQALDVGCGTGRWASYVSGMVAKVEAIDPSEAVWSAVKLLKDKPNVRISIADVDRIPFEKESFDFVYSLGVLHHIPDTEKAMKSCVKMVKKGGYFLVYLYYNLDNRGVLFRFIFQLSNVLRWTISKLPSGLKKLICDILAIMVYCPLVGTSILLHSIGLKKLSNKTPLSYYKKTSFNVIRNDSLDRFGTPLEQRFSKEEIRTMMLKAGLDNIVFSEHQPYWHAIGQKK